MGTSVNQRSPDTPNWDIVQRAYDNPDFPTGLALREVWRAAGNQSDGNLIAQLSDPIIGDIASVAIEARSPADASRIVDDFVSDNRIASLATSIATRAAIQCAGQGNAQSLFVERLFAEATNYLVSRDLPGHITPGSRLQNISQARIFKQELMKTTADTVQGTRLPQTLQGNDWQSLVVTVVGALLRRR